MKLRMMFGLPGIAAIYTRGAPPALAVQLHRRMFSTGMLSTRDCDSALSRQQGAIRPSDARLRRSRERAVLFVPSPRNSVRTWSPGVGSRPNCRATIFNATIARGRDGAAETRKLRHT
jgi:hypothetical protein